MYKIDANRRQVIKHVTVYIVRSIYSQQHYGVPAHISSFVTQGLYAEILTLTITQVLHPIKKCLCARTYMCCVSY